MPFNSRNRMRKNVTMLRIAGLSFNDLDNAEKLDFRDWRANIYYFYSLFVFAVVSIFSLVHLVSIFAFWGDFPVVTVNICFFMLSVDKPLIVHLILFKRKQLLELIDDLEDVYTHANTLFYARTTQKVVPSNRFGKLLVKITFVGSLLTAVAWMFLPMIKSQSHDANEFILHMWYPFSTSVSPWRQVRLVFEALGIVFQATVGSSTYFLLYTVINDLCQNMRLLEEYTAAIGTMARRDVEESSETKTTTAIRTDVRRVIENIGWFGGEILASSRVYELVLEKVEGESETTSLLSRQTLKMTIEIHEGIIEAALLTSFTEYERMYRCYERMVEYFNPLLHFLYLACRYSVSICAFQLALINDWQDPFLTKFSLTIVALCFRLYLVCFVGEKLITQSEALCDAVYNCHWVDASKKSRLGVAIFILRTQTPMQLNAVGMPLSLATFLQSVNDCFSIYSLLRQFNDIF